MELGKELKTYAHKNNCNHQRINEETLKFAVEEMYKSLTKINAENYDLDDFSETNKIIIDTQEEYFEEHNKYKLLSLLCIALIDLGLIEIQGENENVN